MPPIDPQVQAFASFWMASAADADSVDISAVTDYRLWSDQDKKGLPEALRNVASGSAIDVAVIIWMSKAIGAAVEADKDCDVVAALTGKPRYDPAYEHHVFLYAKHVCGWNGTVPTATASPPPPATPATPSPATPAPVPPSAPTPTAGSAPASPATPTATATTTPASTAPPAPAAATALLPTPATATATVPPTTVPATVIAPDRRLAWVRSMPTYRAGLDLVERIIRLMGDGHFTRAFELIGTLRGAGDVYSPQGKELLLDYLAARLSLADEAPPHTLTEIKARFGAL